MGDILYERGGFAVSVYAGPATEPPTPRTRIQLWAPNIDCGGSQLMHLNLAQWAELCEAVRKIGGNPR